MASYPDALFVPRTVENRAGVAYDAAKTKVFYAEDLNDPNAEIVAIQETLGLNPEGTFTSVVDRLDDVDAQIAALDETGGWRALSPTFTRQSADDPVFVLRFGADMTAILGVGMRIKATQNGAVIYLIVVKMGSYTGGNTDVTVYGGTDYDVLDTSTYPISTPLYSREKAPVGFPLDPTKWTVIASDSTERSQASPTQDTWYNLGSLSIVIPIGVWDVDYHCSVYVSGGTTPAALCTLSTANNSQSDLDFSCMGQTDNTGSTTPRQRRKTLVLAAKTTYYLNEKVTNTSASTLRLNAGFGGDADKAIIRAICAFL